MKKRIITIALFLMTTLSFAKKNEIINKSFYMTTDNLKVRDKEGMKGAPLFTLIKNSRVFIQGIGKKDTIDGIESVWVKILTDQSKDKDGNEIPQGKEGWCFGGYLIKDFYLDGDMLKQFLSGNPGFVSWDYKGEDGSSIRFENFDSKTVYFNKWYLEDDTFKEISYEIKGNEIFLKPDDEDLSYLEKPFSVFYECDEDICTIYAGGKKVCRRADYSLFYDADHDRLFRSMYHHLIYADRECIFYSRPSEISPRVKIKCVSDYSSKEMFKIYDMDRILVGDDVTVLGRSLYPNPDGSYWYSLDGVGILEKKRAFIRAGESKEPEDVEKWREESMLRIRELIDSGEIHGVSFSEEEISGYIRAKGLMTDIYTSVFGE